MGRVYEEHASAHHKEACLRRWLRAFAPETGVLRCVGNLDGAPCQHGVTVDLRGGGSARATVREDVTRGC